jgi:hypothetical protein
LVLLVKNQRISPGVPAPPGPGFSSSARVNGDHSGQLAASAIRASSIARGTRVEMDFEMVMVTSTPRGQVNERLSRSAR